MTDCSESLFFNVFDKSPIMIALCNAETGLITYVNRLMTHKLGYNIDEFLGFTLRELDIFGPDIPWEQAYSSLEIQQEVNDLEVVLKTKDGETLVTLVSFSRLRLKNIDYLLFSAIDITAHKSTEYKLTYLFNQQLLINNVIQLFNSSIEVETVLDSVLEMLGEHTKVSRIYVFKDSADGLYTNNTHEWCNVGIPPQISELQGVAYEAIPSWKLLLERDGCIFSQNILELPEDLIAVLVPQGIVSMLILPIRVEGKIVGFIGFDECRMSKFWKEEEVALLRTVSNMLNTALERKNYIEKLRNSQLRLNMALESAREGLWDWEIKTGNLYYSEMWCKMMGIELSEFESDYKSWTQRVHPDDLAGVIALLDQHLSGITSHFEAIYRIKREDGQWIWIIDHGMVVEWDQQRNPIRATGTIIEITKQKETEAALQMNLATNHKLFSIIAHDLRGPIGNFLPILEMLTDETELSQKDRIQFMNELKLTAKSTFDLLENLLNWSRSQSGTIKLHQVKLDLGTIALDVETLLRPLALQKDIQLINEIPLNRCWVFSDKDLVHLVLRNLISNGIKFTHPGGSIRFSVTVVEKEVVVLVKDTGVGMDEDTMQRLFLLKSTNSTRGTKNEKGAGLGLVLCKEFIDLSGGTISVESKPGEGTGFRFTLPLYIPC